MPTGPMKEETKESLRQKVKEQEAKIIELEAKLIASERIIGLLSEKLKAGN